MIGAMKTTRFSRTNRDAGLHRISAITRWTMAGALAGTGAFAGLAAHVGRPAAGVKTGTTASGSSASASQGATATVPPVPSDDGGGGLYQPAPAVAPVALQRVRADRLRRFLTAAHLRSGGTVI